MPEISFYRQARVDGGIRTGVDVDETTVLESYEADSEDFDPALLWYVDLDINAPAFAGESQGESVRSWLLKHAKPIQTALATVEEELSLGFDVEARPYVRTIVDEKADLSMTIRVSAIRRIEGRDVASKVSFVRSKWKRLISQMSGLVSRW
jgi:hypothetical protein